MTRRGGARAGARATSRGRIVSGMARGLAVTSRNLFRRSVTRQYPETKPDLPPRSRGVIALLEENCTVCMLCARECPDWCIYIDSHKEVVPATEPGAKDRTFNQLDRFAIDFSLCMYCGICIEACPFDALFWSPEFEYADTDILDLLHEKDTLREWMWTVPAPSAHDAHATPGKEVAAATKIASGGGAGAAGAATAVDATGAGLTPGGARTGRVTPSGRVAPPADPSVAPGGASAAEQAGTSGIGA